MLEIEIKSQLSIKVRFRPMIGKAQRSRPWQVLGVRLWRLPHVRVSLCRARRKKKKTSRGKRRLRYPCSVQCPV